MDEVCPLSSAVKIVMYMAIPFNIDSIQMPESYANSQGHGQELWVSNHFKTRIIVGICTPNAGEKMPAFRGGRKRG